MTTLKDASNLIKLILPFIKERAKSIFYRLIRRELYKIILKYVSKLQDNQIFIDLNMDKETVSEYLVKILLGEDIPIKDKMKLAKISELIRAGIYM